MLRLPGFVKNRIRGYDLNRGRYYQCTAEQKLQETIRSLPQYYKHPDAHKLSDRNHEYAFQKVPISREMLLLNGL